MNLRGAPYLTANVIRPGATYFPSAPLNEVPGKEPHLIVSGKSWKTCVVRDGIVETQSPRCLSQSQQVARDSQMSVT